MDNKKLFENITLPNGVTINNRVVMAPMTTWGSNDDNTVSDNEISFYTRRARNLGMTITGCTHVSANGIGFENEFSAYDDKFIPGLSKLASSIKEQNTKAILQINHAGNKALQHLIKDSDVVSASYIATLDTEFAEACKTRPLSEKEILEIIKNFGETTRRAIKAGFDGVEIHAAHGFLIQNFTSPYFNKRLDKWGGSLENRIKFPIEITREIKKVIIEENKPNFILGYRLSPDEPMENALRIEHTYKIIDEVIKIGIDYIHISLPNALQDKPVNNKDHTYLELLSKYIDRRVPTIYAGSIKTFSEAELLLENCDFVALGRILVTDPDWLEKAKYNKSQEIVTKLDLQNINNLKLPQKLVKEIIKNKGWFEIEGD
ncbi:NADH-dependent flavin oxidoreductase [Gemella sp. GH3]|uniref:NADH-dependent flavin oxidoreductase n=1 Tax=unclassified Gemella TaxID=2624949 RepID=UPI0015D08632|nr:MULTISPECIES: NADH-dependent flavin oxidoreductase [unclassified Gemella]MBF0713638.1 NADH-dependent flavin oxidoreductase [Gemella sp. GH3.1]NYS50590.1 NADH-dependent flavin oxidoreductase [Gemella sp. GH3]